MNSNQLFASATLFVGVALCGIAQPASPNEVLAARLWSAGFQPAAADVLQLQQMAATSIPAILVELVRLAGSNREGADFVIGNTLDLYRRPNGPAALAPALAPLIGRNDTPPLLESSLIQRIEQWVDVSNPETVRLMVEQLESVTLPSETTRMQPNYGVAQLLRAAASAALRDDRRADSATVLDITSAHVRRSLAATATHSFKNAPKHEEGMKILAAYRRILGEKLDAHLIESFATADLGVQTQLRIIEDMSPWAGQSSALQTYLRQLKSRASTGGLSLDERSVQTMDRLLSKYTATSPRGIAVVSRAIAPHDAPAPAQLPPPQKSTVSATSMETPTEANPLTWWLLVGLLVVVALGWARCRR